MTRPAALLLAVSFIVGCGLDDPGSTVGETDEDRAAVAAGMTGINVPGAVDPAPAAGGAPVANPQPAVPSDPESKPVDDGPPPKRWLVLSNFRKQSQGIQTLGETYRVDYQWAEGTPGDTQTFHLVIEMKGTNGLFEVAEAQPVRLNPSGGTASVGLQRQFGTETPTCFIGRRTDDGYEPISGKLELGAGESTARSSDAVAVGEPSNSVVASPDDVPGDPVANPDPDGPKVAPLVESPIPVPAGLPEKPASPRGSASYSVEDAVLKIVRADWTGLRDVVPEDANGELALMREGKLPVGRANDVRRLLSRVQIAGKETKSDGNRHFSLRAENGQMIDLVVRKRQSKFLVIDMTIRASENGSNGAGNTPDF